MRWRPSSGRCPGARQAPEQPGAGGAPANRRKPLHATAKATGGPFPAEKAGTAGPVRHDRFVQAGTPPAPETPGRPARTSQSPTEPRAHAWVAPGGTCPLQSVCGAVRAQGPFCANRAGSGAAGRPCAARHHHGGAMASACNAADQPGRQTHTARRWGQRPASAPAGWHYHHAGRSGRLLPTSHPQFFHSLEAFSARLSRRWSALAALSAPGAEAAWAWNARSRGCPGAQAHSKAVRSTHPAQLGTVLICRF